MGADELEQLRRDVAYLKDRQAILDCVASHARGHDRHDSEMITAAYHDDGFDEHGKAVNPGPQYAQWINPVHAAGSQNHLHNITTHTCEIDGDIAHAENYVLVTLLNHDGETARFINGRYIDRLEKRDGVWRIAVRLRGFGHSGAAAPHFVALKLAVVPMMLAAAAQGVVQAAQVHWRR